MSIPFIVSGQSTTQFIDNFDGTKMVLDPSANDGWTFFTGDGAATMDFQQKNGYATISVDATNDVRGIWYALIKRCVSTNFDLRLLSRASYELRIEARLRVSHAPRRVNLSLNIQRTTDFHTNLMEFEIADTVNWHTISFTTQGFDAISGDKVYGQLALMDWGLAKYRVDLDYFKVGIVDVETIGPDQGVQVPYHPPVPRVDTFTEHLAVAQDGMIDREYSELNFNNWGTQDETGRTTLLTVSSSQMVILRWNLSAFAGKEVAGAGLLELTTHSLQRSPDYAKDFGMVRVVEILGGDPRWQQQGVTYNGLFQGKALNQVLNTQMIIDIPVAEERGGTNLITISQPVLQRMIDGRTPGIAIRPLGAVNASFYAMENLGGRFSAKLHLNFAPVAAEHK